MVQAHIGITRLDDDQDSDDWGTFSRARKTTSPSSSPSTSQRKAGKLDTQCVDAKQFSPETKRTIEVKARSPPMDEEEIEREIRRVKRSEKKDRVLGKLKLKKKKSRKLAYGTLG